MSRIHKEIYGSGETLVLIHGWSMHSGMWRPFAQNLAKHYRVVCLDLPGHGRSEKLESFALAEISEVLVGALSEAHFHVLGWSLGATVAIEMAGRFPDRVASLTLVAGNPCFVGNGQWPGVNPEVLQTFAENLNLNCQTTLLRFLALQVNGLDNGKILLKQLKEAVLECPPPEQEVLMGGLEILKTSNLKDSLRQLQCPVRLILGDKDTLIPLQCGDSIKRLKPETQVAILRGAGHVPFLSHQQKMIDLMLDWL